MSKRITWGALVKVADSAPEDFCPGRIGDVCGIRTEPFRAGIVDPARIDESTHLIYLVEFSDGTATEIPERYLAELQDGTNPRPHSQETKTEPGETF